MNADNLGDRARALWAEFQLLRDIGYDPDELISSVEDRARVEVPEAEMAKADARARLRTLLGSLRAAEGAVASTPYQHLIPAIADLCRSLEDALLPVPTDAVIEAASEDEWIASEWAFAGRSQPEIAAELGMVTICQRITNWLRLNDLPTEPRGEQRKQVIRDHLRQPRRKRGPS